jgi:hypothetical protein
LSFLVIGPGTAQAYLQYSISRDATNCQACHGDFQAADYVSLTEGADWQTSLMGMHTSDILDGDCTTCHAQGPRFPVIIGSSAGGDGLDPISCSGCHGRAEDFDPDGSGSEGYGAGLRQQHWRANREINTISTRICLDCHSDADPANFTPVDESFLPPYYAFPAGSDPDNPDIPSDPCNPLADGFPENYIGSTQGLDNDGNGLYDEADVIACPEPEQMMILLPGICVLLLLDRRRQRSHAS